MPAVAATTKLMSSRELLELFFMILADLFMLDCYCCM